MTFNLQRAPYPATRLRRLRASESTRRLTREHRLSVDDLIFPMFVLEEDGARQAIPSMPGIERLGIQPLVEEAKQAQQLGIPAIAPVSRGRPGQEIPPRRGSLEPGTA